MTKLDYSFTEDDLQRMRETQTGHMLDQCVIMQYTPGTRNEYNEDDAFTYVDSAPLECGLNMNPGTRTFGEEMTVIRYDAILRLPLHTPITELNKIRIISRYGEYHNGVEWEIITPIDRGPSGIRVYLRKIVT